MECTMKFPLWPQLYPDAGQCKSSICH
jgi:hypothetical protein